MPILYTIGYGNQTPVELLKILRDNGIGHIEDIRKAGTRSWCRQYYPDRLEELCANNGITYHHNYNWANYWTLEHYACLFKGADLSISMKRIKLSNFKPCLLCAEKEPYDKDGKPRCHRVILAGGLIKQLGEEWEVRHL